MRDPQTDSQTERLIFITIQHNQRAFNSPSLWQDFYSAPKRGTECCDARVCLSVCLCMCVCMSVLYVYPSAHISETTCPNFVDDAMFSCIDNLMDPITACRYRRSIILLQFDIGCSLYWTTACTKAR